MSRSIKSIYLKQVYIVKHPIVYKFVSSLTDSSGLSIKPCIFLLFYTELNFQIKTDIVEDNWQFYLFMLILSSRRLKGTKRKTEQVLMNLSFILFWIGKRWVNNNVSQTAQNVVKRRVIAVFFQCSSAIQKRVKT